MHAGKIYTTNYEYGSYSYQGYDIANHFNEHVGFECDYSFWGGKADVLYSSQRLTLILWHINVTICARYPNKEKQFHFFRHYLQPGNLKKELDVECNFDSLVFHIYWAIQAIVHVFSTIDFDYMGSFFLRFDEYKKCKEEVLSLTHDYIASGRI
ncbi:unnamed protein product [Sphagnum troendelagicum]|uniref:ethanolamine kinase n=1 Tax=Sphagnum troendelagicum TaxID=128251 RepID=A0ABP0URH1_9BRYO